MRSGTTINRVFLAEGVPPLAKNFLILPPRKIPTNRLLPPHHHHLHQTFILHHHQMLIPGFSIVRGHQGAPPPILQFFSKPVPSTHQNRCSPPMGCTLHLKMKPTQLKNKLPPPLKREAPFHELIPRKSTINNNLKSS